MTGKFSDRARGEIVNISQRNKLSYDVVSVSSLNDDNDCIILVNEGLKQATNLPDDLKSVLEYASKVDKSIETSLNVFGTNLPSRRLVYSPVGSIDPDQDDVRLYAKAAKRGMERALKLGSTRPLIILPESRHYPTSQLVALLGAMEALYMNFQTRERNSNSEVTTLGVWGSQRNTSKDISIATKAELGRTIARDMAWVVPEEIETFIRSVFPPATNINIELINSEVLPTRYPLFSAATKGNGRIFYLRNEVKYPDKTLFLVGTGLSGIGQSDSGEVGGAQDTCGAAAVIGFLKIVSMMNLSNLSIIGALVMPPSYDCKAQQVTKSRSGRRVLLEGKVGAEVVLADVLCKIKDEAAQHTNPQIVSIAPLANQEGRVCFTTIVDNGVARKQGNAEAFKKSGEEMGEMIDVAYLRKEDFENTLNGAGVLTHQSTDSRRSLEERLAFLIIASGLDTCGTTSDKPIPYSHLDVSSSSGDLKSCPSAAAVLSLVNRFLDYKSSL